MNLKNLQNNKIQIITWFCGINPFKESPMSNNFFILDTSLNWKCAFDDYVDNTNKEWLIFYSKEWNKIWEKDLENSVFNWWFLTDSIIYYNINNKYFIKNLKPLKEKEIKFK